MKFDWFVSYPINNYNVTVNVGMFDHFSEVYQGEEAEYTLDYYVKPGNLDKATGDEIMAILEDLNARGGTTVVMVTHDQRLADRTHRTVRLFDGRQVQ